VANGTAEIAELKSAVVDLPMGGLPAGELIFIFVVDVAGADGMFVDLVKNCLMAALEGIPKGSLIGLLTVADTVGVFDLSGKHLQVKHVIVPESCDHRTHGLGVEELLPLSRFLVPLDDDHEEMLLQAIEMLDQFIAPARRGMGTAVRMLVDYFAAYEDLSGARVGLFIGDRPNWGVGALSSHRLLDIEPETTFYLEEALLAKSVTFDLFCSSMEGETLGLASLKFLPLRTCGVLISGVNPQDLYRLYKTTNAVQCEMAVRLSPDVEVGDDFQGDMTVSTCSPRDSFSYGLEYTSSSGSYSEHVMLQVAFAYSIPQGNGGKLKRFLRVITSRAKTTLSWRMVYPSVLPEVQMTLLTHKIVRACFDAGTEEAREMLRRWLLKLTDLCAANNASLGVFANMKDLPRYVFALLQSPLLRSVVAADDWAVVQVLLSRLPPSDLLIYLYPALSSWMTPEKMQSKRIHLNHAACAATQCPFFVLDTYKQIIVKGNPPPAKDSALRQDVEKIRSVRISGDVVFDTSGVEFEKYIIEEQGFKTFLDEQNARAAKNRK
jgi:hypothetical protein